MKLSEKKFIKKLIKKDQAKSKFTYSLSPNSFSDEDIIKGIEVLLTKKITMSSITKKFEKEFAKYIGSKYALMVNSGSSANLLATFALINPLNKKKLKKGDECLIPSLCWSTSLWPIVQAGLIPKFVDIDPLTLNISIDDLKKKINKKTKAIMGVHILGNSANMDELMKIIKKNKLYLIEDTCESLGSTFNKKYLGSFGDFGTFSFYYSHQITAGEGGMIVCNDKKNYEIIHTLRAHGWDRGLKNNKNNFNFINSGFNLRPLEISAAIGFNQFKRLNQFKKTRFDNRVKIINRLKRSKYWKDQFSFIDPIKKLDPSWFGLPILINENLKWKKNKFLAYLNKNGIETRPIISGNFLNQPSIKLYKLNAKKELFKNAQNIEDRGFFIGIHVEPISNTKLDLLEKKLLKINEI
ncbi:DegT/DnrJ/EryC1/StrS family aminotransferase [Candidatus Pelagibacter ubique]|nr:DegT/DnrJ/EryC1/StrS family aminotransferase [Candidatus Pelagibacter ubique]